MLDLRPLRSAAFRHLAAALWVNETGNAVGEVALSLLVYDRTGSPLATATLFVSLRCLPALLAPLLTTYAEALNPRAVLSCMYVVEAGLFVGIAALARHFSLPLVLAAVVADGAFAIVATTLNRSAITNNLMTPGLLRQGNGLVNLGTMVAFAVGPVIAGSVVAWSGARTALLLDALSFLVAAAVIASARGVGIESDREAGALGRIKTGAAILRTRRTLRRLIIAVTVTVGLASVADPIQVVFARTTLHAGSTGYGLLLGTWGLGMVIGGGAFAVARDFPLMKMLGYSTALLAFGYCGIALSPTLLVACVLSCLGGIGNGAAWVAAMTATQERIPLSAQSTVMSLLYALNLMTPAVGFAIGGIVTSLSSPRLAYAIAGLGTALAVVSCVIRPIDRAGSDSVDTESDTGAGIDNDTPASGVFRMHPPAQIDQTADPIALSIR